MLTTGPGGPLEDFFTSQMHPALSARVRLNQLFGSFYLPIGEILELIGGRTLAISTITAH
jgi:hypothetical protein